MNKKDKLIQKILKKQDRYAAGGQVPVKRNINSRPVGPPNNPFDNNPFMPDGSNVTDPYANIHDYPNQKPDPSPFIPPDDSTGYSQVENIGLEFTDEGALQTGFGAFSYNLGKDNGNRDCTEDPAGVCCKVDGCVMNDNGEHFTVCSDDLPENRGQRSRGYCADGDVSCGACCTSHMDFCWEYHGAVSGEGPPYLEHPLCVDICVQGDNYNADGADNDGCNYQPAPVFGEGEPCRHNGLMNAGNYPWINCSFSDYKCCGAWNNAGPDDTTCCEDGSLPSGAPGGNSCAVPSLGSIPIDCEEDCTYYTCDPEGNLGGNPGDCVEDVWGGTDWCNQGYGCSLECTPVIIPETQYFKCASDCAGWDVGVCCESATNVGYQGVDGLIECSIDCQVQADTTCGCPDMYNTGYDMVQMSYPGDLRCCGPGNPNHDQWGIYGREYCSWIESSNGDIAGTLGTNWVCMAGHNSCCSPMILGPNCGGGACYESRSGGMLGDDYTNPGSLGSVPPMTQSQKQSITMGKGINPNRTRPSANIAGTKPQYPGKPQELSPCLGEQRLLENPPTEGGLKLWAKELNAHIIQYGGMDNYPAGECFGTTGGTPPNRDTYICGDLNNDGNLNVLDVVTLVNCILTDSCGSGCNVQLSSEAGINVLDLVTLVNCVLADVTPGFCGDCPSPCNDCPEGWDNCFVCGGDGSSCADDCTGDPTGVCCLQDGCIMDDTGEHFTVCSEDLPVNRGQRNRGYCLDGEPNCGACCTSHIDFCWIDHGVGDGPPYLAHVLCVDICVQGDNYNAAGADNDGCNYQPAPVYGEGEPCRHNNLMDGENYPWINCDFDDYKCCGAWSNAGPDDTTCCETGAQPSGAPGGNSCDYQGSVPIDCIGDTCEEQGLCGDVGDCWDPAWFEGSADCPDCSQVPIDSCECTSGGTAEACNVVGPFFELMDGDCYPNCICENCGTGLDVGACQGVSDYWTCYDAVFGDGAAEEGEGYIDLSDVPPPYGYPLANSGCCGSPEMFEWNGQGCDDCGVCGGRTVVQDGTIFTGCCGDFDCGWIMHGGVYKQLECGCGIGGSDGYSSWGCACVVPGWQGGRDDGEFEEFELILGNGRSETMTRVYGDASSIMHKASQRKKGGSPSTKRTPPKSAGITTGNRDCPEDPAGLCCKVDGCVMDTLGEHFTVCSEDLPANRGERSRGYCADGDISCGACCTSHLDFCWEYHGAVSGDGPPYYDHPLCMDICVQGDNYNLAGADNDGCNYQPAPLYGDGEPCRHNGLMDAGNYPWINCDFTGFKCCGAWNNAGPDDTTCCEDGAKPSGAPDGNSCAVPSLGSIPIDCIPECPNSSPCGGPGECINVCNECTPGGGCFTDLCGCDNECLYHTPDSCGVCDGDNWTGQDCGEDITGCSDFDVYPPGDVCPCDVGSLYNVSPTGDSTTFGFGEATFYHASPPYVEIGSMCVSCPGYTFPGSDIHQTAMAAAPYQNPTPAGAGLGWPNPSSCAPNHTTGCQDDNYTGDGSGCSCCPAWGCQLLSQEECDGTYHCGEVGNIGNNDPNCYCHWHPGFCSANDWTAPGCEYNPDADAEFYEMNNNYTQMNPEGWADGFCVPSSGGPIDSYQTANFDDNMIREWTAWGKIDEGYLPEWEDMDMDTTGECVDVCIYPNIESPNGCFSSTGVLIPYCPTAIGKFKKGGSPSTKRTPPKLAGRTKRIKAPALSKPPIKLKPVTGPGGGGTPPGNPSGCPQLQYNLSLSPGIQSGYGWWEANPILETCSVPVQENPYGGGYCPTWWQYEYEDYWEEGVTVPFFIWPWDDNCDESTYGEYQEGTSCVQVVDCDGYGQGNSNAQSETMHNEMCELGCWNCVWCEMHGECISRSMLESDYCCDEAGNCQGADGPISNVYSGPFRGNAKCACSTDLGGPPEYDPCMGPSTDYWEHEDFFTDISCATIFSGTDLKGACDDWCNANTEYQYSCNGQCDTMGEVEESDCPEDPTEECCIRSGCVMDDYGEHFTVCSDDLPVNRGQRNRGYCLDGEPNCGACCTSNMDFCWVYHGPSSGEGPPYIAHPLCMDICVQGDNYNFAGENNDGCNYQPAPVYGEGEPCRYNSIMDGGNYPWINCDFAGFKCCGAWSNAGPGDTTCCETGAQPSGAPGGYSCDAQGSIPVDCEPEDAFTCEELFDGGCGTVPDCDILDECGVCGGVNADMDCTGECFGDAVEDCNGDCGGSAEVDECGVCNGGGVCDDNSACNYQECGDGCEYPCHKCYGIGSTCLNQDYMGCLLDQPGPSPNPFDDTCYCDDPSGGCCESFSDWPASCDNCPCPNASACEGENRCNPWKNYYVDYPYSGNPDCSDGAGVCCSQFTTSCGSCNYTGMPCPFN